MGKKKKDFKGINSITKQFMTEKTNVSSDEEVVPEVQTLPVGVEVALVEPSNVKNETTEVKTVEKNIKNANGAGRPKKEAKTELKPMNFKLELQHIDTFTDNRFARRKKTDVDYLRWLIEEDAKRIARGE